ncbi:putative myosin light chain kinase [Phytophthora ramorum]|uniref:Protein kinase domain-containing protein n=1 Tax=Phytophthora ramorum TaxID=164328 RepID=H3H252_PHYRM|nr:putative myosin light chain kinase [Phytophthora ramorum]
MTFSDRRFLRLPRRMAGAAALCAAAAACSGLTQDATRLDAARRPMGADAGCALLLPSAALKPQRVDPWRLTRSRLQQEYDLEGVIGEGGFGLVHVGRHRASNSRVAIKRVSKQLTTKENFLQEVGILKQVGGTHNVLQLRDAFETSDAYVLVTELVQGGELYDDLVEHGVFGEQRAKELVRELAVALEYLHSKHVVHADLKPENILLANDKHTSMRLIDFGQSFRLHEEGGRKMDVCTTAYASPEFIEHRESGCAMDVWALGVVLYIVLCGSHPFDPSDESTDEELQQRIRKGDFDRDSAGWACMSDSARNLVRRMLTLDPEKRISAAQVLEHEWVVGA